MFYEFIAHDLSRGLATLFLLPTAALFILIGLRLWRVYLTDRSEYIRNQERSVSPRTVIRGGALSFFDSARDERVSAGIAVDTKTNEWVEQGKLSEEAIFNVLR